MQKMVSEYVLHSGVNLWSWKEVDPVIVIALTASHTDLDIM